MSIFLVYEFNDYQVYPMLVSKTKFKFKGLFRTLLNTYGWVLYKNN